MAGSIMLEPRLEVPLSTVNGIAMRMKIRNPKALHGQILRKLGDDACDERHAFAPGHKEALPL